MTQSPPDPQHEEWIKLREGMLAVTLGWAGLEDALALLLQAILTPDLKAPNSNRLGTAIYFAPDSAQARLDLIQAAITNLPALMNRDELCAAWEKTAAKVGKGKTKRNLVAHGTISTVARTRPDGSMEQAPRMTAPIFQHEKNVVEPFPKKLPGLSSKELQDGAQIIKLARQMTSLLTDAVLLARKHDAQASLQKLRELDAVHARAGGHHP